MLRPLFLNLDSSLAGQTDLRAAASAGRQVAALALGPALRLWSRPAALEALRSLLAREAPAAGPELVFAGSGDFHHVAPLLIERAMAAAGSTQVTVLHFDNHPDWVRFSNGAHCGSWVGQAARLPGVARVITVGVCSGDIHGARARNADLGPLTDGRAEIYPYSAAGEGGLFRIAGTEWLTVDAGDEAAFAALLAGRIATRDLYVTIDKDVLRAEDAVTNWDQGRMSLNFLERLTGGAMDGHRLIGADVVGDWSAPVYGGGLMAGLLKGAEAWLDQPRRAPDSGLSQAVNQRTNLRLLSLFGAAA